MPRANSICGKAGCPSIATRKGYCEQHAPAPFAGVAHTRVEDMHGQDWPGISRAWLAAHPYCEICGERAVHVDHIIASRDGGDNGQDNLQSLCRTHHSRKTAREVGGRRR